MQTLLADCWFRSLGARKYDRAKVSAMPKPLEDAHALNAKPYEL